MDEIQKLFVPAEKTEFIEERLMDAVVCASGSSPAFVYSLLKRLQMALSGVACRESRHIYLLHRQ